MDDEFSETMPKAYQPDFPKELGQMATSPVTGQKLVLETLIDFVLFDENQEAQLDEGRLRVRRSTNSQSSRVLRVL